MPITVLHLIASNFFGGPERQIAGHAAAVSRARVRCIIGGFVDRHIPNELLQEAAERGHSSFALAALHPWSIAQISLLKRFLVSEQVQLLCAHGYRATTVGLIASKQAEVPMLAFARGQTAENLKVRFFHRLAGSLLRYASGIVTVSEAQARELRRSFGLPQDRVETVYNAIDAEAFGRELERSGGIRAEFGIPPGTPLVVAVGRLSPEKGHRYLVDAARLILGKSPQAMFLLVGEGPERRRLRRRIAALGLGNHVLLTGFRRDVPRFLRDADLVALPSLKEGLPNILLEAAAAQRACVATAVGGVPELVEHGVSGLLVPAADPTLLGEAVSLCLNDAGLRSTLGQRAREVVQQRFRFDQQARLLEALYVRYAREIREPPGAGRRGCQCPASPQEADCTPVHGNCQPSLLVVQNVPREHLVPQDC